MKRLPVVFVSGPYRDPRGAHYIRKNIRAAEEVAVKLWQAGIPCICPHLNTALMDGAAPDQVFLDGDLEILRRCDAVVLVKGWENSSGTAAEKEYAHKHGIKVFVDNDHVVINIHNWMLDKELAKEETPCAS